MTTKPRKMINRIGERRELIIYIMLSEYFSSSPTLPPTLIFSRGLYIYAPCPPIF